MSGLDALLLLLSTALHAAALATNAVGYGGARDPSLLLLTGVGTATVGIVAVRAAPAPIADALREGGWLAVQLARTVAYAGLAAWGDVLGDFLAAYATGTVLVASLRAAHLLGYTRYDPNTSLFVVGRLSLYAAARALAQWAAARGAVPQGLADGLVAYLGLLETAVMAGRRRLGRPVGYRFDSWAVFGAYSAVKTALLVSLPPLERLLLLEARG